ncbi:MAG: GGDEF domain-containing protein [Pseudomonadales bacterium]|nr:GGDEF domain-containing protein [Pseudomonadales bacterium]
MSSKHTPSIARISKATDQLANLRQATTEWQQSDNPLLRLSRRLGTTLILDQQVAMFADSLKELVEYDQLTYRHRIGRQEMVFSIGLGGQHHCEYRLNLEGENYGLITINRRRRFAEEELAAIEQLLSVAICPIRNACQFAAMQQTALTDALTRVPNKRALDESLLKACSSGDRHGEEYSLILCDLDHFKRVNDTHGHIIGDHLLQEAAAQIEQAIRSSDGLFRFGGEEFAILLPHTTENDARLVAERIRARVSSFSLNCGEQDVAITCSLGVATRQKGEDTEQWQARADEALYRAKSRGRNQTRVSDRII